MATPIRTIYVPVPTRRRMTFTFVWRFEDDGDFYEQDYPNYVSLESAYKTWRKVWGCKAEDCVVFEVKMKNPESSAT